MAIATSLTRLRHAEFLSEVDVLAAIYRDAMNAAASTLPGRRDLMRRHSSYPEFRAVRVRTEPEGQVVGFAYGFRGEVGQWWFDAVWTALRRSAGPGATRAWLSDCMEIAEVHVLPGFQRSGIGTSMLMALTRDRAERTAVLSTPDQETTARRLYRRLGFTDLLTGYSFPGGSPPYAIMGAPLPLESGGDAILPSARPSI